MNVEETVSVKVLDKTANTAVVKKFDESQNIYIYDLLDVQGSGENEVREILATNRYSFVDDAPFVLTDAELLTLKGENNVV